MRTKDRTWRNWGRTVSIVPTRVEHPVSVEEVQRTVVLAVERGMRVKAIGSGHSFTDIAAAPDVQLSLDGLSGVISVDAERSRVTLAAGTPLHQLSKLLQPYGLALQNMGDIDRQTLAGATSTGTHGTGGSFGGLATQIVALTLVVANGEKLRISETENPDLLPAARVALGALGVITDLTIQCVPAFLLRAVERPEPLQQVVESYVERSADEDHFEFYWFPHTEIGLTKTNTRLPLSEARVPLSKVGRWVNDELLANQTYRAVCALGAMMPGIVPPVNRFAQRVTGSRSFTDHSPNVFVSNRAVRFREMEYALPREAVPEALHEMKVLIKRRGWRISFPLEVRSAAADDNWLSTAYGQETGYIAIHRYYRENPREYFVAAEEIMKAHGGRPHWGKVHFRQAGSLREVYPRFEDFLAVRNRLDPERRFENAYLRRVLGS
ncbi:D-arabinono-1,4-lactone oxidase [Lysinibacter sp. HNR]|uniref:D-arabinono-1,4-lactone oxidase n=1 Tax=Lysinibacter sp. HNR TaxID=3031408 RepID=UPI002434C536|nr:D-arabinono-1,4-lactone oxidase [Lysinibacter sp. HNR]WGD36661.1 D-arabinono-1,4-lactone oxidase [Lysinibacter sp. HNR]